jgi:hypothetical protein
MPLDPQFVIGAGATGVLLLVFAGAIRGDLRFRPGIEAENKAKDAHIALLERELADEKAHSGRLVDAVDKLADALEARNRRDERSRRVGQ